MHGKEFIADCIRTFFTVATLINIAMYLMGVSIFPDTTMGYEGFIIPVIYGLAGTIPNFAMYSNRELRVGELMVRKVLQLLLTEVCVLVAVFSGTSETDRVSWLIAVVALSVFIIFVVASLFDWIQNYLSAKQIMEDLKIFQGNMQK